MWADHLEYVNFSESMLTKLADLLQRGFPLHEISLKTLRRITVEDPNFLPSDVVIATENDKLRGAAIGAMYRKMPEERVGGNTAFLKAICTVPHDGGLMHGLLERAVEGLKEEGAGKVIYSNFASWHLLPGVDLRYENILEFLLSEGFRKRDQCVDYVIDLQAFRVPRRISMAYGDLERRGVEIRLATPEEKETVNDWVMKSSGFNWSFEASRAIGRVGSGVWLAEEGKEIVGFSVFGALEYHWFGPIGVAQERRKEGLGSALLFKTLESMKSLGIPRAIIPWTGHLFFYSQIPGIVGLRHYWMMEKDL
jgi:GNAT superfamily N-acetyltransferase